MDYERINYAVSTAVEALYNKVLDGGKALAVTAKAIDRPTNNPPQTNVFMSGSIEK